MIEKHDLPCPFCGADAYIYCYEEHPEKPIYVSCSNCDCDIPLEQWNMRAQPAWQKEPTEDGWYWIFDPANNRCCVYLCNVETYHDTWVMTPADDNDDVFEHDARMKYIGPLRSPKEPEV